MRDIEITEAFGTIVLGHLQQDMEHWRRNGGYPPSLADVHAVMGIALRLAHEGRTLPDSRLIALHATLHNAARDAKEEIAAGRARSLPHDADCPKCLDPNERYHSIDRTSPEYLAYAREVAAA